MWKNNNKIHCSDIAKEMLNKNLKYEHLNIFYIIDIKKRFTTITCKENPQYGILKEIK